MAMKNDLAVKYLTAEALGATAGMESDIREANKAIMALARDPNPQNRYLIGQVVGFTVDNVMKTSEDFIRKIADEKRIGVGDKAQFKVRGNSVKAYIQAKGATTPRSKVTNRFITVETEEVSARPYVNYLELAAGKVDMGQLIRDASNEMIAKKLARIEAVLHKAAAGWTGGQSYAAGAGLVKATIDPLIRSYQRVGKVSLVGDIEMVSQFNSIAGFNGTNAPSDAAQDEIARNGFIGSYIGANVVQLENPFYGGSMTPVLSTRWLYIVPAGSESPLKVVHEGDVSSLDQTNIDDASYELCLRQLFGAAVAVGDYPTIGAYQDTKA